MLIFLRSLAPRAASGRAARMMHERRGATAVEFAIVLPVLVTLALGIMEFGWALWTQNALHYSVEQAARCASIDTTTCGTPTQIVAYATQLSGANVSSTNFSATVASCGNRVSAVLPIQLNIPFFDFSLTLTAQSCYPI